MKGDDVQGNNDEVSSASDGDRLTIDHWDEQ
jgi:hypothetical protein